MNDESSIVGSSLFITPHLLVFIVIPESDLMGLVQSNLQAGIKIRLPGRATLHRGLTPSQYRREHLEKRTRQSRRKTVPEYLSRGNHNRADRT
jgi:hypothetical protein